MVWSRYSRCATNVEGHKVKGQGHDIKTRSITSQVSNIMVLRCLSHFSLRIIAHEHVRELMTRVHVDDSLLASWSGVVLPSGIEAVVVDAC